MNGAVDVSARKRELRTQMRQSRDAVPPAERAQRSAVACAALTRLPELVSATVVAGFVAARSELDPAAALDAARANGAVVVLPRVSDAASPRLRFHRVDDVKELRPGAFGIAEPPSDAPEVPASALSLVLLPGLAFDAKGGRLGYGGGYYDELLAKLAPLGRAHLVGVAFDSQLVTDCPRDGRDETVDVVVTDERVLRWRRAA